MSELCQTRTNSYNLVIIFVVLFLFFYSPQISFISYPQATILMAVVMKDLVDGVPGSSLQPYYEEHELVMLIKVLIATATAS